MITYSLFYSQMSEELLTRSELIEKICLLQDYILTLQGANHSKYQQICWQSNLITQLKQQTTKLKRQASLPSLIQSQLQQKLRKSIQTQIHLQKENQKLRKRIAELESKPLILGSSRIKDRSISPCDNPISSLKIVTRAHQDLASNALFNLSDSCKFQIKRNSRYSFDPEPISSNIETSPTIGSQNSITDKIAQVQNRSFELNGGTFSFSNLQDASVIQTVIRQRTPSRDSPRNFRKLTLQNYRPEPLRKSLRKPQ